MQNTAPNSPASWQHFYRITGTTAQQTVQVQLRDATGTGETTTIEDLQIIAFKLPANADFQYAETEAIQSVTEGIWSTQQSLTFTPSSVGDYLIMAVANATENPGGVTIGIRLQDPGGAFWPIDSGGGANVGYFANPRKNWQSFFVARVQNLSGSQTYSIEAYGSTGGSQIRYTRIMAFRTDVFDDFQSVEDTDETSTTSSTPVVKSTLTTTAPPAARDYIVIQSLGLLASSATVQRRAGFEADDVVQTNYAHVIDNSEYRTSFGFFDAVTRSTSVKYENTFSNSDDASTVSAKESVIHVLRLAACTFSYRKQITIQSSQVSGSSDFTDFPVLISLSGNWLKTTTADPTNGRIENANGYDIIFKDSTDTIQLDHEIERYDGSASGGTLVVWVRIPTLSYSTDTVIYIYYGNPCVCSSQENITGVWDSDYVAVWHFKESLGTVYDSSSNDNDASPQGTPSYVDAKIGKAYNTTNGYFSVPYSSSLDFVSGSMFIECWAKYDDFTGGQDPGIFVWNDGNTDMFGMNDPNTPRFRMNGSTIEAGTASAATWYYYVGRYTGSNMYIYHNTNQLGGISKTGNTAFANGTNTIGYRSAYTSYIDGIIDELRISKIDRGVDYMTTTYNNQNSPASFYNVGSENYCGYSYRKPITIDNTKVSGSSDLTNFPALINLSGNWLKTTTADPTNGRIENANGYDIIFKDSGGTQLDHEIEDYDGSASGGTLVAWVRIPTLSYSTDTVIYIYYGNPCVSSSQENITGVWDSNFKGVWHLNESTDLALALDSTSYGTSGTVSGTVTRPSTGKIGNAYDFFTNGTVNYGNPADGHLDAGTGSWTVSYWANIDANRLTWDGVLRKGYSGWGSGYYAELHNVTNNMFMNINDTVWSQWGATSPSVSFTEDTWFHFVAVVDRTANRLRSYKNGSEVGSPGTNIAGIGSIDTADSFVFGDAGGQWFDGILDEVRVSNTARTADWIQTEYNNHNSPSTFYSEGSEEETGDAYLAEHAAGQEADKFGSQSSVTGAELFAFKLTNEGGNQVTVSEVQFQLSSVTGIVQGDFLNIEIYVDTNNDGTIGSGETTTVGGTGTVNAGVTTITFSTDFNISASTTVNYILKGDVSNLVGNDTVTIDLGTSNVTLSSGSVGGTAPTSVTHTSDAACEYSSWRQITIDNTMVSGTSDLTNFPLLVSLAGDWLKTTTADTTNGRITNSSGYDIIFKDTGGTQLDHEIEDYDGTNGTLVAWVRIPTLSYDTDTVIYVHYGNPCISSSQENATGVWFPTTRAYGILKKHQQ